MTDPRSQKDKELSRVYSEGAWPEPRRQIDDAILAASRRAARARHPVLHRWGVPFALAATVVLGVSLALMVSEQESGRELRDYFFRANEPAAEKRAPQAKRDAAPAPAPRTEPAPKAVAPAPKELFASPMGPTKPAAPGAAKAPAQAPAAKAPAPSAAARAPVPQPQRRIAPADDPRRADRIKRDLEQLEETRQAREAAPPREPVAATPAAPAASTATVSDLRGLVAATGAAARPPEAWLDDIRKLKAQGRAQDAERELVEFRKRYPDYRVPEDLR